MGKTSRCFVGSPTLPRYAGRGVAGDIRPLRGRPGSGHVAETEAIAVKRVTLIRVEYEDLPAVYDAAEADEARGAAHPPGNRRLEHLRMGQDPAKGDVDVRFCQADVNVEGEYHRLIRSMPTSNGGRAGFRGRKSRITVNCGGQWTHADREAISHAWTCPKKKYASSTQPSAARLADGKTCQCRSSWRWRLEMNLRSKSSWKPKESIVGHGKRHPMTLQNQMGRRQNGKLLAAETTVLADAGLHDTTNKVLGNCTIHRYRPVFHPQCQGRRDWRLYQQRPTWLSAVPARRRPLWMAESQ